MTRLAGFATLILLSAGAVTATQPAVDPGRAAGITVIRSINTAENAVLQRTGKYIELTELLSHAAMGRVRGDIVVNGSVVTHRGQQLRLTLTRDAKQYQVMVVPGESCGTAVFSDERGLIYTGKVLDC